MIALEGLTIRRATLDDLDQLVEWRMEVLHAVFADATARGNIDRDVLREANRAYYARALGGGCGCDPGHIACFAELDGEPIACGSICLQEELPSPDNPSGRCAYLMNMYTRPAHRGEGIAGEVIDWVVDQAKRAGAEKIYLETTPAGRGVYERAGFVDLPDMMKLEN